MSDKRTIGDELISQFSITLANLGGKSIPYFLKDQLCEGVFGALNNIPLL